MPSASKTTTLYSSAGYGYTLSASFVETQTDTINNTSTISCTAQLIPTNAYWGTSYQSTLSVYWHDNKENIDKPVSSISFAGINAGETKTTTGTITVYHKDDGTLSGYAYAYFLKGSTTSAYAPNSGGITTDLTALTNIDRYPLIVSATNFNDEENPSITYSTNLGFENASTYACISLDGTTDNVSYRQVNINDGAYTFSLTTSERNVLRNGTPNSNILNVYFILKTVVGNTNYFSKVQRQMTIVNAKPTYTHTEVETVQKVINVLGSSSASSLIQNASIMRVTIVPTALKGSSIASVRIVSGLEYEKTITTSPYVFDIPTLTTGTSVLTITDSRGNIATRVIAKTYITYTPVSLAQFTFERENPTSSDIILNFEGNYLQKNFNSTANVPTVRWKLGDGSYTTIPSSNYSIDTTNNKITISDYELTNALNYRTKGTFWIELSDLLTSSSDSQDVLKGIPTFDYGEHDLKVNGDFFIADEDGDNPVNVLDRIQGTILWQNQNPTSSFAPQNIQLSSNNYDMLLWMFSRSTSASFIGFTCYSIKGYGVLATTVPPVAGANTARRGCTYSSDTVYEISNCTVSDAIDNTYLVPLYVIGLKTGLF